MRATAVQNCVGMLASDWFVGQQVSCATNSTVLAGFLVVVLVRSSSLVVDETKKLLLYPAARSTSAKYPTILTGTTSIYKSKLIPGTGT